MTVNVEITDVVMDANNKMCFYKKDGQDKKVCRKNLCTADWQAPIVEEVEIHLWGNQYSYETIVQNWPFMLMYDYLQSLSEEERIEYLKNI